MTQRFTQITLPLALIAACGLSSCLANARVADLYYPPHQSGATTEASHAPGASTPAPVIQLDAFRDKRRWPRIGEDRSEWGFHLTRVEPDVPVSDWLRSGLRHELEAIGLRVNEPPAGGSPPDLVIKGRIRNAYTSRRFDHQSHLRFTAFLHRASDGRILASRIYDETLTLPLEVHHGHVEPLSRLLEHAARDLAQVALTLTATDTE